MCKNTTSNAILAHEDLLWNSAGEYFDEAWEHFRRGHLKGAKDSLEAALDFYQQLQESARLNVANCLTSIGCVLEQQGRLQEALEYHDRARATYQLVDPNSQNMAASFNNIAIVLQIQGKSAEALELFSRARTIQESIDAESVDAAATYSNIGMVLTEQAKYSQAHIMFSKARRIQERLAPNGLDLAVTLTNIGELLHARYPDCLDKALCLYEKAQDIREQQAPDSLPLATSLRNIANIHRDRGQIQRAADLLSRALSIQQRIAPESLDLAKTMKDLAKVLRIQRDVAGALCSSRHACNILLQPHIGIVLSHPVYVEARLVEGHACLDTHDYIGAATAARAVLSEFVNHADANEILRKASDGINRLGTYMATVG